VRRLLLFLILAVPAAALFGGRPEAVIVAMGDVHSAYDRYPQVLAEVDRMRRAQPGTPLAVLVAGDTFEFGNVVSRRSGGELDFALLAELRRRAPVVLALGNHEPDLFSVEETTRRLQALGVAVVCGNLQSRQTGQSFAPASVTVPLGEHTLTVVGIVTDGLAMFRAAVRPELDLTNPTRWAEAHLPELFRGAEIPVVLSHAGLAADRPLLSRVPDGTLFIGAHDHLRFVHEQGRTAYVHSGSWLSLVSVATLVTVPSLHWKIEQHELSADGPADADFSRRVHEVLERFLTAEERAIVGQTERALSPAEAARFAVEEFRRAAAADVAIVGGTTFGGGLPAGDVSRFAFDGWVRFDGIACVATVTGTQLKRMLERCNQDAAVPFARRVGENLVATGLSPGDVEPGRTYRVVTTDWGAKNSARYFGIGDLKFTEQPSVQLKAAVLEDLGRR
jgi:2',3'-cyclic-nucleotide 2'-phosphodiesterase (5'-nucleotidase family)